MSREVFVTSTGAAFEQRVDAGPHRFRSDEPASAGGADAGPGPYDLLLAALGSCTAMTIGLYARHKRWPLERVTVRLAHSREHARDCADCEEKPARIERIERRIALAGGLDAAQRTRLIEIAEKCPVHRTLTGGIEIRTTLADPGAGGDQ